MAAVHQESHGRHGRPLESTERPAPRRPRSPRKEAPGRKSESSHWSPKGGRGDIAIPESPSTQYIPVLPAAFGCLRFLRLSTVWVFLFQGGSSSCRSLRLENTRSARLGNGMQGRQLAGRTSRRLGVFLLCQSYLPGPTQATLLDPRAT